MLATNTFADLEFRQTIRAADFNIDKDTAANRVRCVAMSDVFADIQAGNIAAAHRFNSVVSGPTSTRRRIDPSIPKTVADTGAYGSAWYVMTSTPAVPLPFGVDYMPGMPARVTVAVTTKNRTQRRDYGVITLRRASSGVYRIFPGLIITAPSSAEQVLSATDAALAEDYRNQFLAPCSWALSFTSPGSLTQPTHGVPRWFHVGSSWAMRSPSVGGEIGDVQRSYVSFRDAAGIQACENASQVVVAYGFTGIIRLEERTLPMN
jgi:hypothetical protein